MYTYLDVEAGSPAGVTTFAVKQKPCSIISPRFLSAGDGLSQSYPEMQNHRYKTKPKVYVNQ